MKLILSILLFLAPVSLFADMVPSKADDTVAHFNSVFDLFPGKSGMEWDYRLIHVQADNGDRFSIMVNTTRASLNALGIPLLLHHSIAQVLVYKNGKKILEETVKGHFNDSFAFSLHDSDQDWKVERAQGFNTVAIRSPKFSLTLHMIPQKPKAFFYDFGKPADSGWVKNAHLGYAPYVSETMQVVKGNFLFGNDAFKLTGYAWLDRQWIANSTLASFQWRWFAIQDLDLNTDFMIYEIFDPQSKKILKRYGAGVDSKGRVLPIEPKNLDIKVLSSSTYKGRIFETSWLIKINSAVSKTYHFEYFADNPWTSINFGLFTSQFTEAPMQALDAGGKRINNIYGWGEQVSSAWVH